MRFILVSADDPNLQRPLDVPDELVSEHTVEPPKKRHKAIKKEPSPSQPKRIKSIQKSRAYG